MDRIAVFGAANVDIGGFPFAPLKSEDSNPGRVRSSMGGVGRNIACNLARLGVRTELVTALGADHSAALVAQDCARAGVGLGHAVTFPDEATSTYLFIAQDDGDMVLAVNDMGIHERMTPTALREAITALSDSALFVLDANLPAETLSYLAAHAQAPVVADAVSTAKAARLRDALPHIARFKPNRVEAEALTGMRIAGRESAESAVEALLRQGCAEVYCTLGTHGLCFGRSGRIRYWPGVPARVVNATGAGDAFTAALAWSAAKGMDMEQSALAGLAAASVAVEAEETVSPLMSEGHLLDRMADIARQIRP